MRPSKQLYNLYITFISHICVIEKKSKRMPARKKYKIEKKVFCMKFNVLTEIKVCR